jgi:hypothetical protein
VFVLLGWKTASSTWYNSISKLAFGIIIFFDSAGLLSLEDNTMRTSSPALLALAACVFSTISLVTSTPIKCPDVSHHPNISFAPIKPNLFPIGNQRSYP